MTGDTVKHAGQNDGMRLLDNLRLPLIIGVLLVHCNVLEFLSPEEAPMPLYRTIIYVITDMLYVTVPAFFFISGYFFYRSGLPDRTTLTSKLKRRLHTLVIPYFLWNLIGLCLTFIKTYPPIIRFFPQYDGFFDSWRNILCGFIAMPGSMQPYDFPMWFIRNLIFVVLLTPLLTVCLRYLKAWILIPLFLLMLWFPDIALELTPSMWFFSLGAVMAVYGRSFSRITAHILPTAVLFLLLTLGYNYFPEQIPQRIAQTVGVFFLASCSRKLTERYDMFPSWLTNSVFFIYACHGLYCTVIDKAALEILSPIHSVPKAALAYLLAFIMNIGLTVGIYVMLRRISPRLANLLCGKR